jgi:uncharacterized membrane protein
MNKLKAHYGKDFYVAISIAVSFFIFSILISFTQFIWLDEAYTLNTTTASIAQVWSRAIDFEGQPPLYFIILKLWRLVSNSFFFSRLLSIFLASVSAFFVFRISERYIKNISPLLITLLFAFNPIVLWAALEIRVYAMVLLFSVILIWVFLNTYTSGQKPLLSKRILYSILALLSVYIQYYLVFLLIGNFVFLIINKEWKSARLYVFDMILPILGFIFLISNISNQMSIHYYQNESSLSLLNIVVFPVEKASMYLFPYFVYMKSGFVKLIFLLFFFGIILYLNGKIAILQFNRKNYFFIISAILLTLFTLLLFFTDKRNIAQRHSILLLLPLLMTLAIIAGSFKSVKVRHIFVVLLIAGSIFVDIIVYGFNEPKGIKYINISNVIMKNDIDSKPVFCFRYDLALILKYCLPNQDVIPIPINVDFDSHFDRRKWVLKSTHQLDSLLIANKIKYGFWLVTSENETLLNRSIEKKYNIHYDYEMLNNYISSNFIVEMEKQFSSGIVLRKVSVPEEIISQ